MGAGGRAVQVVVAGVQVQVVVVVEVEDVALPVHEQIYILLCRDNFHPSESFADWSCIFGLLAVRLHFPVTGTISCDFFRIRALFKVPEISA